MQKAFTQKDIERAIRGARKGGLLVARVEISPGGSIIIWSSEHGAPPADELERELDQWKRKRGPN
jgi:hypothetical protein